MAIARDEIFGPVLSVIKFKEVEEVDQPRQHAPTTAWPPPSGPATSARPTRSPTAIRAGTVWINCYDVFDAAAPSAASRGAASAANSARKRSTTTPSSRPSPSRLLDPLLFIHERCKNPSPGGHWYLHSYP